MPPYLSEKKLFQQLEANKSSVYHGPRSIDHVRNTIKQLFTAYSGPVANFPSIDLSVPVRGVEKPKVGVRVFNPNAAGGTHFFLPGNTFVFDLFESNAVAASRMAAHSRERVVIVNPRLMPEYPWPTSIDDVVDVLNHLCREDNELGIAAGRS